MEQISVITALNSKRTFYSKQWQSNGYYPIDKFVWDSERGMYEQLTNKSNKWKSRGYYAENNYWQYIFEHNPFILSFDEMTNTRKYNCE